MNHDRIDQSMKPLRLGKRRRGRDQPPKAGCCSMLPIATVPKLRKASTLLIVTMLFQLTLTETANGLLHPLPSSKPITRRTFDSKSTSALFQTSGSSSEAGASSRTNDEACVYKEHRKKDIDTNPGDPAVDFVAIVPGGIGSNAILDRRTMTAVVTGRTLAVVGVGTGAILGVPMLSQATALSLPPSETNIDRSRDVSSSSPAQLLAGDVTETGVVDLPLEYIPTLNAYVVRYSLFGESFAAIVDTGSPFLTAPCYCKPYRTQKMFWGCYKPELTSDSGYANTIEGFDNNYGTVVWRKAGFSFSQSSATETMAMATESEEARATPSSDTTDVVFGVLDRDLLNGSGGVFFGLIKETDRWIRPSFLGQTGYTSFCVDLRHTNANANASSGSNVNANDNDKSIVDKHSKLDGNNINGSTSPRLVLSKQSMIGTGKWRGTNPPRGTKNNNNTANEHENENNSETENCVPLVRDLRTRYGAPVVHYTARASKFVVNGMPLLITKKNPLYVIFDTGVSGMVVSSELFDGRNLQARKNKEKSLWGTVEVSFATKSGNEVTLSAKKPLTTPLGKETPWKGFKGNLIAVGLAFLDGLAMTVDVDDGKILFVEG